MASVIRVNTINSRSGLSTVTFDNSGAGIEVAGIITATGVIDAQGYINLAQKIIPVSYTHLTLPTTPYV